MQKDILEKYIIATSNVESIENMLNRYRKLKKETNDFSDIVEDEDVYISSNTVQQLFLDFLNSYDLIHKSINMREVIENIENSFSGNEFIFWSTIIEYFEFCDSVRNQTNFLKELDIVAFQDLILYTFNRNIKFNNFIKEYKSWSTDEIRAVYKLINTILYEMIEEFHDFETMISDFNLKFDLEIEKYQYIWNLCEENKTYLMLKNIQETLNKENVD